VDPAVRCPMCAEEIGADLPVCPFCGTRLMVTFHGYCTSCHAVVDADRDGPCRRCGTPVADLRAKARPAEEARAPAIPPAGPPSGWASQVPVLPPAPPTAPPQASWAGPLPAAPQPAPSPAVWGPPKPAAPPPAPPPQPPPRAWWDRASATRPAQVPAPRRTSSWVVALVFVLVVVVVLGLGIGAVFLATGGLEMLKPVASVTFDTVGQYPEERRVTLEGRLRLPSSVHCDDNCGVYLVDPGNPERELPLFIDVAGSSATAAPNQMERLSLLYETGDFRVHLDDGGWAGDGALVRVTGHVCRTTGSDEACVHAQLIEQAGG
jgi:hypothetical protein